MKRFLGLISVFFVLALAQSAVAVPADDFDQGVAAYNAGNYDQALRFFESVRDSGLVSPELFYNLGNCYYKTGHKGLAVAFYMQAAKLDPRNRDIQANLHFVRSTLRDKYEDSIQNPIWKFVKDSALFFRANELTWCAFFLYLLLIAILIFQVYYKRRNLAILITIFSVIFLLAVSGSLLALNINLNYNTHQAVITEPEVDILAAPGAISDVRFTAHEGLTFRILKQQSGYYEGIFANNLKGWIEMTRVYQF